MNPLRASIEERREAPNPSLKTIEKKMLNYTSNLSSSHLPIDMKIAHGRIFLFQHQVIEIAGVYMCCTVATARRARSRCF